MSDIKVTVWNEFRHERKDKEIASIYPEGIHGAIASALKKRGGFEVATATLDEPDHGLTPERLAATDVLIWWGHQAHAEVRDEIVDRVQQQVLSGMGIIVLHSAHMSKIFRRLLGTNCTLVWREAAEKERLWNVAPGHEITDGIGDFIELPHEEMYGEPFAIPDPDKLLFLSWFAGGEAFRSGCAWERGNGRLFYFQPGHETYPTYHNEQVLTVIANAARWAQRRSNRDSSRSPNRKEAFEKLHG